MSGQWLLFDLGGVLVEFSGARDLPRFLRTAESEESILRRWVACETTRAFETGQLTPEAFGDRFVKEWDLSVPPPLFLREFQTWTRGFFPGAADLLAALRAQHRLACLSNSNQTHWAQNEAIGILRHFDVALSSHQLGCHKPDREIYMRTLGTLNATPEHVVFFDDSAANVAGAQAVGIAAYQVRGIVELTACLRTLGLIGQRPPLP
jgi:HAD superfamily hydrolase (TIGR01509 family)